MTRRQGDKETRRRGDGATGRRGDREVGRSKNKETRRRGDREMGRGENKGTRRAPPRRPVTPSLRCPVLLFILSLLIPLIANAQTGEITGRVVSEGGSGIPNMTVYLSPAGSTPRAASDQPESAVTDGEGNFKFTGLAPRLYFVSVSPSKGYTFLPVPASERTPRRNYRPGDSVTFTLIKGGVITGRVTTLTGDPMIGVQVSLMAVKDFEGKPMREFASGQPRTTDDRGVYRFYGIFPGTYVVFTRGNIRWLPVSAYEGYAPTYHPSSPRETAAEITVGSGDEVTGVDIRYRGERGATVSGVVTGSAQAAPNAGTSVSLYNASTGAHVGSSSIRPGDGQSGFAILGVTDGEYEIIARRAWMDDEYLDSPPRRIAVRGADVGGIELKVAPKASVSGKIVIEDSPKRCEGEHKPLFDDMIVSARRATKAPGLSLLRPTQIGGSINDSGAFKIGGLDPSHYFIIARSPDENQYVKSIAAPVATTRNSRVRAVANYDVSRVGLTVKSGDRMKGLIVTIADGAASLRGSVAPENEGSPPPAKMRVHLVPAETAAADDLLRYGEVDVGKDNAFEFKNITPGKYRLLVRAAPNSELNVGLPPPVAWDANERAKLRKEAEAMKIEVELKPCQRVSDQVVKYR
jgi:hypothetical protein